MTNNPISVKASSNSIALVKDKSNSIEIGIVIIGNNIK